MGGVGHELRHETQYTKLQTATADEHWRIEDTYIREDLYEFKESIFVILGADTKLSYPQTGKYLLHL